MVDDVAVLELSGLLTAKALSEFADKASRHHGCAAAGFVIDYRRGTILATREELGRLIDHAEPGSAILRPGAFVTAEPMADMLVQHAERLAWRGLWRRVFADIPQAIAWVKATASLPLPCPRKKSA